MKIFMTIIFLLNTNYIFSSVFKWRLQITDPSYELKHVTLPDSSYKSFMKKTSWRCYISETRNNKDIEIRSLRCNYSIQKSGEFTGTVSCSQTTPFGELLIDLTDEKKNLSFKVRLFCEKK